MEQKDLVKPILRQALNAYSVVCRERSLAFQKNLPLKIINNTGLGDTLFTGPSLVLLSEYLSLDLYVDPKLESFVKSWNLPNTKVFPFHKHDTSYKFFNNSQVYVLRSNFIAIPFLRNANASCILASSYYDYYFLADQKITGDITRHYFDEHLERAQSILNIKVNHHEYYLKFQKILLNSMKEISYPRPDCILHLGGVTLKYSSHKFIKNVMKSLNLNIINVGSDSELDKDFKALKNLSLSELLYVLHETPLFVGSNSGVSQIARFASQKLFVPMGPSSDKRTGTYLENSHHIWSSAYELPCYPCQNFDGYCYNKKQFACLEIPDKEKMKQEILNLALNS